uniref:Uncharacterized protein n=1 Tax=Oryza brachyantha TaxID=4533 RepID=J3N0P2_ORYBR
THHFSLPLLLQFVIQSPVDPKQKLCCSSLCSSSRGRARARTPLPPLTMFILFCVRPVGRHKVNVGHRDPSFVFMKPHR